MLTLLAESARLVSMAKPLIGTTQAAERCGVDRSTFFRWVQLGRIEPVQKLPGQTGAMLFDPDVVDAYAATIATEAAS